MNFQDFLIKYNGQQNVGNTPENTGECVGLVACWVDELQAPHIWGNAKDLLNNASRDFFTVIPNTPDAIPEAGDIVVWSGSYNSGPGHTGIATGTGDTNTFECFEQNDPLGSNCHLHNYNYNFVDGWLRFNSAIITQPIPQPIFNDQTIIDLGQFGKMEVQAIRGKMGDLQKLEQDNQGFTAQLGDLSRQLNDEFEKNRLLTLTNTTLTKQFRDLDETIAVKNKLIYDQTQELLVLRAQKADISAPTPMTYTWSGLFDYLGHVLKSG